MDQLRYLPTNRNELPRNGVIRLTLSLSSTKHFSQTQANINLIAHPFDSVHPSFLRLYEAAADESVGVEDWLGGWPRGDITVIVGTEEEGEAEDDSGDTSTFF